MYTHIILPLPSLPSWAAVGGFNLVKQYKNVELPPPVHSRHYFISTIITFSPLYFHRSVEQHDYPSDCSLKAKTFPLRDFVIGSAQSVYALITPRGTDINVILRSHDSPIHALVSHPTELVWLNVVSSLVSDSEKSPYCSADLLNIFWLEDITSVISECCDADCKSDTLRRSFMLVQKTALFLLHLIKNIGYKLQLGWQHSWCILFTMVFVVRNCWWEVTVVYCRCGTMRRAEFLPPGDLIRAVLSSVSPSTQKGTLQVSQSISISSLIATHPSTHSHSCILVY